MIKSGKAIVETLILINEENTYPIVIIENIIRNRALVNGKRDMSEKRFFIKSALYFPERYLVSKSSSIWTILSKRVSKENSESHPWFIRKSYMLIKMNSSTVRIFALTFIVVNKNDI